MNLDELLLNQNLKLIAEYLEYRKVNGLTYISIEITHLTD